MSTKTAPTAEQTAAAEAAKAQKAADAAAKKETAKAEREAAQAAKKEQAAKDKEAAKAAIQASRDAKRAEREAKANAPKPDCGCGCGAQTKGGRFLPGHDARLHARVKLLKEGSPLPAGLSLDEIVAAEDAFRADEAPTKGSFRPRWDASKGETAPVKPRAAKDVLAKRIANTEKLLATLKAEFAAA